MIKDKFLNWLVIFICIIVSASMLFHSLPYWWIGGVIAFLFIGFYLKDEEDIETDAYEEYMKSAPYDWEDYKSQYEPPDEYNLPDDDWTTTALSAKQHNHYCKKCKNKVYQICMCKPLIKDNTD